jgi:hypothetical protein
MSIDVHAIVSSIATWGHAAVAVLGALAHKVWSKLVGAEKKAAAEIEKLKADAEAAAKKIESKL